ncbi:Non-canonical non-ribosomal peptide synthetase-like protein 4 [Elsinoe fawcettii]|nr:Non-canonical non-ribosomal peptide synthetase-like protein 4 [Elsinoe fawcettii]
MIQTVTSTATLQSKGPLYFRSEEPLYTIDELIRRRASELQDSPLLAYPKSGLTDYEEHSASTVDRYIDAAVETLQGRGLSAADSSLPQAPVVAILAHSSLHFIITLLALNRLGYAALLLSPRLASPAMRSLLEQAQCRTMLTTSNFQPILAEVQRDWPLSIFNMLKQEDYRNVRAPVFSRSYDRLKENPKWAVIIHSSGSTGMPKPIYLTHRSCLGAFALNLDRRSLMTQPLFHSFGFYETFRAIYSGKPMFYFNYDFPITKQNLIDTIKYVKPDLFFCVPYILKLLGDSEDGIQSLAAIDLILFGGSACPDSLGDALVRRGVNMAGNYGATETGRMMTSVRPQGDLLWNYMRILPETKPHVLMDEIAPGIYEAVALESLKSRSTVNSDNPANSFRTKDLFQKHPSIPNRWKFVSRLDDRLTLYNGEKVLPIPIEGHIRRHPLVREAIVYGDGKTIPGLIVIKADEASSTSDEEYLQSIWPTIEEANANAESFSRVPRDLIIVLPADVSYARTDKGTFIRAQVYAQFKDKMEKAYSDFETGNDDSVIRLSLSVPELETYLFKRFHEQLGVELPSLQSDFFAFGIDSLQCIKMWSLMKKELDLGGNQTQLGQNVLYETGNIKGLARHLAALRTGEVEASSNVHQIMNDLVGKYSHFDAFDQERLSTTEGEVVVLTGATGGLGAHLLAQLVRKPNVTSVWALTRAASDEAALGRTLASLASRDISLSPKELSKVVAVPSDLSKPDFGLGTDRYEELRSKVTSVVHSAWAVNFNLAVQSFEDQHIKAVQTFINFCQSTTHGRPARFFFCSSVSSTGGTPRPDTIPETPVRDISHVQGTGYAQSKYVAESIVRNAARDVGADARVLRIGQLVGDSKVGEWNTTEGIPLMIQTAVTLGALPTLDESMTWLPVDTAASVIIDLLESDSTVDSEKVYHILNPSSFHWTEEMLPALRAAGLKFEPLPTAEWMERLRNSERDPEKNPPIKLLDWFESKYGSKAAAKPKGALLHETKETGKESETIGKVPSVTDAEYMGRVVARLRRGWEGKNKA